MKTPRDTQGCPRAWQVEAAEDGRLSKGDIASFERHAMACEVCKREAHALAELRELALHLPTQSSTPLERRRLRNELLRRAHEGSTRAPGHAWLVWFASTALVASAAAAFFLWPRLVSAPPAVAEHDPAPAYHVIATRDADWRTLERGRTLRLSLRKGELDLSVSPLRADQRFIVELPDGELEVKGTRFVVQTDGARTLAVNVLEGRVALRIRQRESELLSAGDDYRAPAPEATATRADAAVPQAIEATSKPARARPRTNDDVVEAEKVVAPAPASPFTLAMSAFNAGDYGRADELFAAFERTHPDDSRLEDALFLRAVARARRGDDSGARMIALEYLKRFPNGLRKADAERLSR